MRIRVPGAGLPTVSGLTSPSRWSTETAPDSVWPYTCLRLRPIARKKRKSSGPSEAPPAGADGLLAEPTLSHAHAHRECPARCDALKPARVGDLHLVLGAHGLPEAWRRDQELRADLAQIVAHGGRLFREVHGGARVQRDGDAQQLLADPRERQER